MTDPLRPLRIVAVNGSLHRPSKTGVLIAAVAEQLAERLHAEVVTVELSSLVAGLAGGVERDQLGPDVERALVAVENADVLVVGSPVYRASFTGLFKHFFDFVGQYALVGTPVLLTATGGGERHALAIDHQLRPLFGFFQALTLPIGVYGSTSDFADDAIASASLRQRIDTAVQRAAPIVEHRPVAVVPARW